MKKICLFLAVFLIMSIGFPAFHADAAEEKKPTLYLEYVSRSNDVVTFELRFDDPVGVELTQFDLFMKYSDNVTLVSCEKICRYGMSITSINPTDNPYQLIWVWGEYGLPKGKTAVFSLDFKLSEDFGEEDTVDFELWYNPEDLPADVPGNIISDSIILEEQSSFKDSDMVKCSPVAGDVNSDGNITLADVSAILKQIAAWDIEFNPRVADALYDGKVNLSDVSLMLKYIAKWDGIRLGHNDSIEVIEEGTCQTEGKGVIRCSECDSTEEILLGLGKCNDEQTVVKEATCIEDGAIKHFCNVCKTSYITKVPRNDNHDYDYGVCRLCYMNHPDYVGHANTVKLREYCDWIVNNGIDLEDGGYAHFGEDDTGMSLHVYYPEYDTFGIGYSVLSDDGAYQFVTTVEIVLESSMVFPDLWDSYKYYFSMIDVETQTEYVSFDGFIGPTHLKMMDWEIAVNSRNYPEGEIELFTECRSLALEMIRQSAVSSDELYKISGVDITPEDLGFAGY